MQYTIYLESCQVFFFKKDQMFEACEEKSGENIRQSPNLVRRIRRKTNEIHRKNTFEKHKILMNIKMKSFTTIE